jgi:hypothetical protein
VLWLGRALLMNPIGLLITGIAVSAYLIYRYWEPIKGFFNAPPFHQALGDFPAIYHRPPEEGNGLNKPVRIIPEVSNLLKGMAEWKPPAPVLVNATPVFIRLQRGYLRKLLPRQLFYFCKSGLT